MNFDVIIVGAGPAGIAAAHQLKLNTLLIEKGKGIDKRTSKTSGFGGAGLFSDGKLIYSSVVGGNLQSLVGKNVTEKYLIDTLNMFNVTLPEDPSEEGNELVQKASGVGLELLKTRAIHLGTDGVFNFSRDMLNKLNTKILIQEDMTVNSVKKQGDLFVVSTSKGDKHTSKYVILAPGREGAEWLSEELTNNLGIKSVGNRVDLGIRMELPNIIVEDLVEFAYDFKLYHYSKPFDDQVRTFCVCPGGHVVREKYDTLITCNGHSYSKAKTNNTNFAILVSIPFGNPIDPIKYGKSIVSLANNISDGGVIIQRLTDLEQGRRTTGERLNKSIVKPTLENPFAGDLSLVIPHRYLDNILGMLRAMDKLAPGVMMGDNLLYGVEVKFYSNIIKLSKQLETEIPNLFCIGDGGGVSRGILQAAASGLIVADVINGRTNG